MNQPYYQNGAARSSKLPSTHLCEFFSKPVIAVIGILGITCSAVAVLIRIIFLSIYLKLLDCLNYSTAAIDKDFSDSIKTLTSSFSVIITSFSVIAIVFTIAFSLFKFIPYIVIYSQSKKGKRPIGAVTVLQVASVLSLISSCNIAIIMLIMICILIALTGIAFAGVSAPYYDASIPPVSIVIIILILMIIILAAAVTFMLIYSICQVRLAFSAKKILKDQSATIKGAKFLGVYNIIAAIINTLYLLSLITSYITILTAQNSDLYDLFSFSIASSATYPFNSIDGFFAALIIVQFSYVVISVALCITYAKAALGIKKHMDAFDGIIPVAYPYGYGANYAAGFNNSGYNNYNNNQNYNNGEHPNAYNDNQTYCQNNCNSENGYASSNNGCNDNKYDELQNNPYSNDNNN